MLTTKKAIMEVTENLGSQLETGFSNYADNHKFDFSAMTYAEAHDKVCEVLGDLKSIASGVSYEGFFMPKFIANFQSYEDSNKLTEISFSVRTALRAEIKFSNTVTIGVNDIVNGMAEAIKSTLTHILTLQFAAENLLALNTRLASVMDGNETQFSFTLGDNFVEDIDDKMVVFGATVDAALAVSSLAVMQNDDSDEFLKVVANEEAEKIANAVKGLTTPQIIKLNLDVIKTVTESRPLNRADKLLRQKYHNQAKFFTDKAKEAVGYVYKTLNEGSEDEVTLFSLLRKDNEGNISVKLSPFDIKKNLTVDYDILNNYKD